MIIELGAETTGQFDEAVSIQVATVSTAGGSEAGKRELTCFGDKVYRGEFEAKDRSTWVSSDRTREQTATELVSFSQDRNPDDSPRSSARRRPSLHKQVTPSPPL